ncbi:hypothetical protein K458DRAFT_317943 [Lentithecium fluviatile CBS 122367]|uniref:Knr4/Smi1-like domain-containing protein n=1 Tax=Lentithecium fluviatile CBS 122367 TaxID=1168545 RepID=A0A6G1IJ88_9PLEO|nr:hypothetical protein K458DRAFT_317943 [Lentithecium fluviatile CBS 122367]
MGRKFDKHQVLRQKDPWEVARSVFDIALEFALLGYVDRATELYNLFETFAAGCKASWSPGLYFAWEATGLWPDSIPAKEQTSEFLRKLETERIVWKRETNLSEEGLEKLITVATGGGTADAWGEKELRADELTAAMDLALYMNRRDRALDLLQVIADNWNVCWEELSRSRQAWRYLKHHALARSIEIDEAKLEVFFKEVLDTFKERLERGAARVFKDMPIKELVRLCNDNTIKNAVWEEMDIDPDEPPETILHEGATEAQVKACEERIGHDLPNDLKDFLRATNGMESLWNGFCGEPRFLSTDEIHVFDGREQQEAWEEAAVEIGFVTDMSIKPVYPRLERAIQINGGDEQTKFVWLLEPELGQRMTAAFFDAIQQLPEVERKKFMAMLGYFHAGVETTEDVGWQVCTWCPAELSLLTFQSFKEYLEKLTGDTANEDIFDETDAQGRPLYSNEVFAYQLRS